MSQKTYLILNLHAHLPYIPASENGVLEENWFFEAVTESYIPLISMMQNLSDEGIKPALTFSLSPTLGAMLENEEMEKKLTKYVSNRLALCEKELETSKDQRISSVILMYRALYESAAETIAKYSGDLITPLKRLQHNGQIEIITTSATHAVMPLISRKESIRAQISLACDDYKDRFNRPAAGFWLPECAYDGRLEKELKLSDIKYFFLESRACSDSFPNSVFSAYRSKEDLNYFFRDSEASRRVWSADFGYPGNGVYREFYKDIGYDRDLEYLYPYTGTRIKSPTGLKYYRITEKGASLDKKEIYDYESAQIQAEKDARDFLNYLCAKSQKIYESRGIRPLINCCFDAELFGHWWFEGPEFLENVIRIIRKDRLPVQIVTPCEYLQIAGSLPCDSSPCVSSWGEKGYFDPWINDNNDFIYPKLYEVVSKTAKLADRHKNQDLSFVFKRALNQLAREVLLAQSSDWAFMIYVGPHGEYAKKRFNYHIDNAVNLIKEISERNIDEKKLLKLEKENFIFRNADFRIFCSDASF
ncbi:MAG: DUF1957 domain-containing protein [Elusimicrobia bacterium]|nr:DUF1957 domain-containing protein [Elusimicrobiota bacterium]